MNERNRADGAQPRIGTVRWGRRGVQLDTEPPALADVLIVQRDGDDDRPVTELCREIFATCPGLALAVLDGGGPVVVAVRDGSLLVLPDGAGAAGRAELGRCLHERWCAGLPLAGGTVTGSRWGVGARRPGARAGELVDPAAQPGGL
jgi:hypothetical protein